MHVLSTGSSGSFETSRHSRLSMPDTLFSGVSDFQETPPTKAQPQPSWRSLFTFTTRKHLDTVAIAIISTIGSGLLRPASAIFFGKIFSILAKFGAGNLTGSETLQQIATWVLALTALGIATWITEGLFFASWVTFGELQATSVREKMFEGLLDKDIEWFDMRKDGIASLLIRIQTQIRELQLAVSQPIGYLLIELVGTISALSLAFYYSWQLTLVILASFPIAAVILYAVSASLTPAIERQKRELSEASGLANTAITYINTVKAYNGEDHEVWQYSNTIKKAASSYLTQARCNATQFGIVKFVIISLFVSGFWFGLHLVGQGVDPGKVLTTFYACLYSMHAIEVVLPQWLVISKGMSAGETLKSILAEMKQNRRTQRMAGTTKPNSCGGDIEVNGVSFAYPSNLQQLALQQATFFFPQGETTFIVGKSGSGKSTLGNLLLKYYEANCGEILVDGHPIQTLDDEWLRQNITLVQQQSVLFNETVLQNIAFGSQKHCTRQDILDASLTADLEQTLEDLPGGLDTVVGSNGKALSGGQQQRIAIARARLRDAPIVILDEATSALDQKSRAKIMNAIRQWRKGKTTIIITHDVTQILDEEYVYVMERGKVVQEGYRKKLAEKNHGTFASFLASTDTSSSAGLSQRSSLEKVGRSATSPFNPFDEGEEWLEDSRWDYLSKFFGMHNSSPKGLHSKRFGHLPFKKFTYNGRPIEIDEEDIAPDDDLPPPAPTQTHRPQIPFLSPSPETFATFAAISPRSRQNSNSEPRPYSEKEALNAPSMARLKPKLPPLDTDIVDLQIRLPPPPKPNPFPRNDSVTYPGQQRKQATFVEIFKTVWPTLLWNERASLVLGFFSAFVVAASTPAFAYIFSNLLSVYYLPSGRGAAGLKWALALLGVATVTAISAFCTHLFLEYAGQAWVNALRVEALRRILAQPRSWFDQEKHSPTKLVEYLDRNAEEMRNLLGRFAGPVFMAFWLLGITVVWCFIINWKLTLVALATAPAAYAESRAFGWVTSKWEVKCNKVAENTSSIFTETFLNIRVVRAFTLECHFSSKYAKAIMSTYKTGLKRAIYSALLYGLGDALNFWTTAVVFYYGTVIISKGSPSDVSNIIKVVNLLLFGITNTIAMITLVPQISSSKTTATHILYLTTLPTNTSHEVTGTRRLETPFPIQFKGLNFTYPSHTTIQTLTNINLTINPSTITAIVGPSGSGKSTLSSLLLALYPPSPSPPHAPSLTFSRIPVSELSIQSLRDQIAVIPQQPHIFPTSIHQNITYGLPALSPYASAQSVTTAAKEAGIHDFITSLPNGYSTLIGEGGQGLSGGQAQRIVIARALVRRSKLLVMDEATSALDAVSAEGIRNTIKNIVENGRRNGEGTAVVVVSHSREMMRIADELCVLESGCLVERGGFEELRNRGGALTRLIGGTVGDGGGGDMSPIRARTRDTWFGGGESGSGLGIKL